MPVLPKETERALFLFPVRRFVIALPRSGYLKYTYCDYFQVPNFILGYY